MTPWQGIFTTWHVIKTPLMYNHTYSYAIEDYLSNRTHAGRTHHPISWNTSVSPLLVAKMSVGDPAQCMPSVCCLQVQDVSSMFYKTGSTTVIGAIFWGVIGWCSAAIITASWSAIALPYPCRPRMVYWAVVIVDAGKYAKYDMMDGVAMCGIGVWLVNLWLLIWHRDCMKIATQ